MKHILYHIGPSIYQKLEGEEQHSCERKGFEKKKKTMTLKWKSEISVTPIYFQAE